MWNCIQEKTSKTRKHLGSVPSTIFDLTQDIWIMLYYAEGWPFPLSENEDKCHSFFFCQVEAVQIIFMIFQISALYSKVHIHVYRPWCQENSAAKAIFCQQGNRCYFSMEVFCCLKKPPQKTSSDTFECHSSTSPSQGCDNEEARRWDAVIQ